MLNTEFSPEADAPLGYRTQLGATRFLLKLEVANNPTGFLVFNVCFKAR